MKVGDIVVRIKDAHAGMKKGDIGEIKYISTPRGSGIGFNNPGAGKVLHSALNMRMADELEIAAYRQGITNIKDIPEDFQTTFIPLIWN